MATFYLRLEQEDAVAEQVDSDTIDDLRGQAVRYLGRHLTDHPDFAAEGHWRLTVENRDRQSCMHVIVATVRDRHCPPDLFGEAKATRPG